MNGKKAKRLRRAVRDVLGLEKVRLNGVDTNKIGCDQYQGTNQVHALNADGDVVVVSQTIRCHPGQSRAVYQAYKRLVKTGGEE